MPTANRADGLDSKLGRVHPPASSDESEESLCRDAACRVSGPEREIGGRNMDRLYILYDANCGLCSSVREWVQDQPQLIAMEFVAANSPRASQLFPTLSRPGTRPEELIVVDDRGGVYREGHAWIMCLYAL